MFDSLHKCIEHNCYVLLYIEPFALLYCSESQYEMHVNEEISGIRNFGSQN